MNPKLVPILQRIIARDSVLRAFDPDNLPQSALYYVRKNYLFADGFTDEEYDLLEDLPPFADIINVSIRAGQSPDASQYHVFDDGSLLIVTNAFQQVWPDARDYAVEIILPRMELSRMDADLLRAIGMDDAVESVRDDFFHAFAEVLHKSCGIPHCDARGHWDACARQLSATESERCELGGSESGAREGMLFAETFKYETVNA